MSMTEQLEFLEAGALSAARELIGWQLFVDGVGGTIVETEAYTQEDAASHSFNGQTPRNSIMFGPAGHVYVYFTYGMHWCMNIVTGKEGQGEAVLIRAILPEVGVELIRKRRGNKPDAQLTNGPAKVCQALGISSADNGLSIDGERFHLKPPVKSFEIEAKLRIGISKDKDRLWRFVARSGGVS